MIFEEVGAFRNCKKNEKSQRKMFSNKGAKIDHFHRFRQM